MKKLITLAVLAFALIPIPARAQSADAIIDRAVAAYTGSNASTLDPAEQFLNAPRTRFTVTSSGTANVSGRATHAITLVPKRANAGFTSAKVWIDDADSSIRQFDVESANGLKRHVVITSFTPNPELSKSTFRFAVPKGAKIVDQSQMSGVAY